MFVGKVQFYRIKTKICSQLRICVNLATYTHSAQETQQGGD